MNPEELAEQEAATAAAAKAEADAKALSQKPQRTEKEKAAFSLRSTAERLKELGGDPAEILGLQSHIETNVDDEDEKPVTVGMLRDIQKKDAQKTALQLADSIEDEDDKAQVKEYLSKRIVPSGDAEADFRLAFGAVRSSKNKQILEEVNRRSQPRVTAAGGSRPAQTETDFVPTPEEARMMQRPYSLTKEKIIAARRRAEENQQ
jgi:hypothetical protein